jgi:hypothetical protein
MQDPSNFVFLGVLVGLTSFGPCLGAIVHLNMSLDELKEAVDSGRVRDHWEYKNIVPVRLDASSREVYEIMKDREEWIDIALGCFALAVNYWRSRSPLG